MPKVLVGPLLGYEGEHGSKDVYTVCLLIEGTPGPAPSLQLDGAGSGSFELVAETPGGSFWRAEVQLERPAAAASHRYAVLVDGQAVTGRSGHEAWTFHVPGRDESPRLAYASCNGFSSADLARRNPDPLALWRKLRDQHRTSPFSLLLMGGDQLYADGLWEDSSVPNIRRWTQLDRDAQLKQKAGQRIHTELAKFYERLYCDYWRFEEMAEMLASIPSCMMWDDHDIFDGWGSYTDKMLECEVYRAVFEAARTCFELFQIRSLRNRSLLEPEGKHYAWALRMRDTLLLALDNRAQRTQTRVMGEDQWKAVKEQLGRWRSLAAETDPPALFCLLSGVPVLYREFRGAENLIWATEWVREQDNRDSTEDDLRDHWRHVSHQGERLKLLHNTFAFLDAFRIDGRPSCRGVLLSGDVHVGSVGVLRDTVRDLQLHQVVSSGIIHPPPTWWEWHGILLTSNENDEVLDGGTMTSAIRQPTSGPKYIRQRNYATLAAGTDGKHWVNWVCEDGDTKPVWVIS